MTTPKALHLINPSHVSFGTAVITPRWLYVLAAATPRSFGNPILVDETLTPVDPTRINSGDVVGIGSHTANALRGYGRFCRQRHGAENRFYVDLLGIRLYWYSGFKDDSIDWYELQVPGGSDWIEYMLNVPPTADPKALGVQNHFSFGVKEVQAAARQLRFNGLHTFDGPEIGRDGKDSLDIYDPDGTRVEIMEFAPRQKPCCHPYSADHPKR